MKVSSRRNNSRSEPDRKNSEPSLIPISIRSALENHELFSSLPNKIKEELLLSLRFHRASPGETLIKEGSVGKSMYILLSGTLRVTLEESETVVCEMTQKGTIFGEIGAFFDIPRTATVMATSTAAVAILHREDLLKVCREHQNIIKDIFWLAKQRYLNTEPPELQPGHYDGTEYQLKLVKLLSDDYAEYSDGQIESFLSHCTLHYMRRDCIAAFQGTGNFAYIPLLGQLCQRDTFQMVKHPTIASHPIFTISEFESPTEYLVVKSETCLFLRTPTIVFESFRDGVNLIDLGSHEFHALNSVQKPQSIFDTFVEKDDNGVWNLNNKFDKKSMNTSKSHRRHSIDIIMDHHLMSNERNSNLFDSSNSLSPISPQMIKLKLSRDDSNENADAIQMLNILEHHSITTPSDITKIMPRFNATEINLSSIFNDCDDRLVQNVIYTFGSEIESLSLEGCFRISDRGLYELGFGCSNLIRLNISNCSRIRSNALSRLVKKCKPAVLIARNLPAIDDSFLLSLDQQNCDWTPTELDFGYCRNLRVDGLQSVLRRGSHLESLSLHRAVHLDNRVFFDGEIIFDLGRLQRLDLTDCAFLKNVALRSLISGCPGLLELDLSFCTYLSEKMGQDLELTPMLQVLSLSHCQRAVDDRLIFQLATKLPKLQSLDLRGAIRLTGRCMEHLTKFKHLKFVDLSACTSIDLADIDLDDLSMMKKLQQIQLKTNSAND